MSAIQFLDSSETGDGQTARTLPRHHENEPVRGGEGLRLTLVSKHRNLEVRNRARFTYACDGRPNLPIKGQVSGCVGRIAKGEMYVARIEWAPQRGRAVPLVKTDTGKYCAHCALALFTDIKISEVYTDDSPHHNACMPLVPTASPREGQTVFRHVPEP